MNLIEKYKARSVKAWYKSVPKGKFVYTMRVGVFYWSTPIFLIVTIGFPFLGLGHTGIRWFLVTFVMWCVGGAVFGSSVWDYNLQKYGTHPNNF